MKVLCCMYRSNKHHRHSEFVHLHRSVLKSKYFHHMRKRLNYFKDNFVGRQFDKYEAVQQQVRQSFFDKNSLAILWFANQETISCCCLYWSLSFEVINCN